MGPRNNEMRRRTRSTVAFHTMGPIEMMAMQINGLGGYLPVRATVGLEADD
jgi:hypothetical protein